MKSGTGLGLSVVHGIVKSHSGAIKVYSEPGKGTSFSVYLPRLVDDKAKDTVRDEEPIAGGNESIMLVDDEQAIIKVEQLMLKKLGYKITAFTDPRDALAEFKTQPAAYDLVISDVTMPHLTGLQLAEAIRAESPQTQIMLCTGFNDIINHQKMTESGIQRVVMKPVIQSDIAQAIREVLDGK